VDFVNIFSDWFEKLKRYPYRSMEIIEGQITGIAVLGSNPPYFMSEPLMYSRSDDDKRESYFLPVYSEHDDHAGKQTDEKTYFISPNNNSLMEFTKENFEKLAQEKADAEARATQFQKDAEDAKAKAETLEKEKADQAVFAQVGSEIEKFATNGKIAFSNDEDKETAKKFAASLPDEDARKAFFAVLSKLVAVKTATKEFGAGEGGSDDDGGEGDDKGDEAKQEAEAQKEADQFMKDGKFTNRADALAAAYKKLGIVE